MGGIQKLFAVVGILCLVLLCCPGKASGVVWAEVDAINCGENHTVVLYTNGRVSAVGDNSYGQCNVSEWTDIVEISTLFNHTVGLRKDGTVVAVGNNSDGQCNVSDWKNIIHVAAGESHTLGLRSDGTVVAVGSNRNNQCNVSNWTGITAIAAAKVNSLGLTENGRVLIRGAFTNAESFYLGGWKGATEICAGAGFFAAIRSDGSLLSFGYNTDPHGSGYYHDIDMSSWRDVRQATIGRCNAFGLLENGSVMATGRNDYGQINTVSSWRNVCKISAGLNHVVALFNDGTLLAAGDSAYGKCNVEELEKPPEARESYSNGKEIG